MPIFQIKSIYIYEFIYVITVFLKVKYTFAVNTLSHKIKPSEFVHGQFQLFANLN